MKDSIKLPFSKIHAYLGLGFTISLLFIFIPRGIYFYNLHQTTNYINILVFILLVLTMLFFIILNYFIPAIKEETALEINELGINSKIRDINIKWDKILDVRYYTGRYSNFIAIDLVDKKTYTAEKKNPFKILLMWSSNLLYSTPLIIPTVAIKGKDKEIFLAVKNKLDSFKSLNKKH